MKKETFYDNYSFILVALFIILVAYMPIIKLNYIFHDDVYYFSNGWDKKSCDGYSQLNAYIYSYARPIGGYIKCFYGMAFDTIPEAKYVRLFNIAVVLLFYTILVQNFLRYSGVEKLQSQVISILTVLLTPYQTPMAQITNIHHVIAAILVILCVKESTKLNFDSPSFSITKKIFINLILFFVMSAASLTYPPSAMLYFSFFGIFFILKYKKINLEIIRNSFLNLLPLMFSLIVVFLWSKMYKSDERSEISFNITEKTEWFFYQILPKSFSYFDAFPSIYYLYFSVGMIILCGLIYLINNKTDIKLSAVIMLSKLFIGSSFLVMTFFPMLVANIPLGQVPHRIFIAIDSFVLFCVSMSLFYVLDNIKNEFIRNIVIKSVTFLFVLIAVFITNYNLDKYYARHLNITYNFLKYRLANIDFGDSRNKVHIIISTLPYQTKEISNDEFGIPTTFWKDDIIPLSIAILKEIGSPLQYSEIIKNELITIGTKDDIIAGSLVDKKPSGRIVIDTNNIPVPMGGVVSQ